MEGGGQGPCPSGEVPSEDMEGGRRRLGSLRNAQETGFDGHIPHREGVPQRCASASKASATRSTSHVASSAAPGRAAGGLALGPGRRLEAQGRSVQLLSFFGGCWLTPLEWGGTSGHEAWSW